MASKHFEILIRIVFGRSSLWLKTINPNAPEPLRLEQENWSG
jgi:hypothetical protein